MNKNNIADLSVSSDHSIFLFANGDVYTMGTNTFMKLGRNTSERISYGAINKPRVGTVIQVGTIRYLTYVVYKDAIYVIGNCEHGLCGQKDGKAIESQTNDWIQIDLSSIPNLTI